MPHISAWRITSLDEFETYLNVVVGDAGVRRCFVIAGDPSQAEGPFEESSALIATGAFERAGIKAIGVGGHPEGHSNLSVEQCFSVLEAKCADIESRGMAPLIATQFGFDSRPFLEWLKQLRARGIDHLSGSAFPGMPAQGGHQRGGGATPAPPPPS